MSTRKEKVGTSAQFFSWRYPVLTLLQVCSLSTAVGLVGFAVMQRWFPLADMLRTLLLDAAACGIILLLPVRIGKLFFLIAFIPLLISASVSIGHLFLFHAPVSSFAVISIFETSPRELFEFLQDFASGFSITVVSLCVIGSFLLFLHIWRNISSSSVSVARTPILYAGVAVFCIGVGAAAVHKGDRLLRSHHLYLLASGLKTHLHTLQELKRIQAERVGLTPDTVTIVPELASEPYTQVIVIGESANRNHLGLYGYHRPTTPRLASFLEDPGFLVFNDVVASDTHTVPNLRAMFLIAELQSGDSFLSRPSLVQVFSAAQFKTWWLSNQITTHSALSTSLIAEDADVTQYLNTAHDEGRSVRYDGDLLPELDKALADTASRKAIFVHLLGSHLSYALRYPTAFTHFTETGDIPDAPWRGPKEKHYVNTYDNSIRYTDAVLTEIIGRVKEKGGRAVVLYVSDHGQEVYDTRPIRGQMAENPSRHMFDVPFLLWLSSDFAAARPDFVAVARARRNTPFITSDFAHTVADLAGIRFEGFQPEKSLFDPEYTLRERRVCGDKLYDILDK